MIPYIPPSGAIYTAYVQQPIATPDVVRNEIRNAVEQGRAPIPLRVSAQDLEPFGMPLNQVNPEAGVPPPELPVVMQPPAPAPPTAVMPRRVSPVLIGVGALLAGVGIAYFVFR